MQHAFEEQTHIERLFLLHLLDTYTLPNSRPRKMHYAVDEQPVSQSSSLLANPTSPREQTQHASTAAVGRWLGERRTPPPASPSRNPARCAQTRGFTESIFSSRYGVVCFVNATPRWYVYVTYSLSTSRELFPPRITRLNQ